jgi:hypothetical protein
MMKDTLCVMGDGLAWDRIGAVCGSASSKCSTLQASGFGVGVDCFINPLSCQPAKPF